MMNVLNFTGNIGRDSETRYTPSGDAITSFSAALTSGYGEKKLTTWLNCSIWGKRGESLAPYLKKGAQVAISGEFQARPYQTKEGAEKLSLEVRVSDLTLIGGKGSSDSGETRTESEAEQRGPAPMPLDDLDSDIPF